MLMAFNLTVNGHATDRQEGGRKLLDQFVNSCGHEFQDPTISTLPLPHHHTSEPKNRNLSIPG